MIEICFVGALINAFRMLLTTPNGAKQSRASFETDMIARFFTGAFTGFFWTGIAMGVLFAIAGVLS